MLPQFAGLGRGFGMDVGAAELFGGAVVSLVGAGQSSLVSMVSGAVASVCLGNAGSAAGPGQSSLVSMAPVEAGGIGFSVPALKSRRCRCVL